MAVLGQIRKRSFFLILVIGMALFAFVIADVFNRAGPNSSSDDPIGVVNDIDMDLNYFRSLVEQTERSYNLSTMESVSNVWDQLVKSTIFNQQFEYLGIDAGKEQIEMMLSQNESITNDPRFQNSSEIFDFGLFVNFLAQLEIENPAAFQDWKLQEESLVAIAKENIYFNLIKAATGVTEKEGKDSYHLDNDKINLKYVSVSYKDIDDSLFTVTENEIRKYINQNRNKYETQSSRGLSYVIFPEIPSKSDEDEIRSELEKLLYDRVEYNDVSKLTDTILGLKDVKEISEFIDRYSEDPFDSIYKPKGNLANDYADILYGLNPGDVFGPYKDGNKYKISRFLDRKKGGSIRASHILISYSGATRANSFVTRNKNEAEEIAKKIYSKARKNVGNFSRLAAENSDGPSKNLGGDLGFFQEGTMTQKFYSFCEKARVGRVGLVETEFGFHIIHVTDKKDIVLVADITREIIPSEETSNKVFMNVTKFEIEAKEKDFITTAENYKYKVQDVNNVEVLEENLPGLFRQRNIVQWAFDKETKVGDIRKFSISSGGYAVVRLNKVSAEGDVDIKNNMEEVKNLLIRTKKINYIKQNYSEIKTLDEFSQLLNKEIETASALTQNNTILVGSGEEPYVIGAAFSMDLNQPSELLEGKNAIFMIEVNYKEKAPELSNYIAYKNALRTSKRNEIASSLSIFDALKSASEIVDNRKIYY
tara:strand:+ start:289 stop:2406 length:2118 start_codon:yes stop_codon:yes gene_type:complete